MREAYLVSYSVLRIEDSKMQKSKITADFLGKKWTSMLRSFGATQDKNWEKMATKVLY